MTAEELADPIKFAELTVKTIATLDDEALLANASYVVGRGEEYLADWYARLAQSVQSRREESNGIGESQSPKDGGANTEARGDQ